jgi:hypothetical protein
VFKAEMRTCSTSSPAGGNSPGSTGPTGRSRRFYRRGFDHFFAACGEEFKKGEPEMPLIVKLAAEYGIEFTSDPRN